MAGDRGGPPSSGRSGRGLDWLNFLMSDVQEGFGSFVSFYLAHLNWSKEDVGLVLTAGGLAGVASQMPAGALVDALPANHALVAVGIAMIVGAALLLALWPSFVPVFFAEVLHGITGGIIGPAIGAISLGLVGRRAMSGRIGRNHRFDAAGNALTAVLLGVAGAYLAKRTIFLGAAALAIPTLIALGRIRPAEIDYGRARNAADSSQPRNVATRATRPLLAAAVCDRPHRPWQDARCWLGGGTLPSYPSQAIPGRTARDRYVCRRRDRHRNFTRRCSLRTARRGGRPYALRIAPLAGIARPRRGFNWQPRQPRTLTRLVALGTLSR